MSRILLIEDDPGVQLLFRNRLQELGNEVVVASTGARGLLEARAEKFDLFLVDIALGSGINGYEVCQRLKGVPRIRAVPVVLISGQVKSQEELHRGYAAGCEAFLVKSDLTLIEDVVRVMLRIKSLQDELASQNRLLDQHNRRLHAERQAESGQTSNGEALALGTPNQRTASRPDAVLLVDSEGTVCMADRGARDLLGEKVASNLSSLAPGTGFEAFVRDARTGPREGYRFDIEGRSGAVRTLTANVLPTVPSAPGTTEREAGLKVVLLHDGAKRRAAAEETRLADREVPCREMGPLLEAARRTFHPRALVGASARLRELREDVARAARGTGPVCITGEPGTGKRLVARILHFHGGASGPFMPLHCGALTAERLGFELFGGGPGGEGDAPDSPGLFQLAQDGTLFLDHVDDLPLPLQAKLSGALESGVVAPMGSGSSEPLNVRVVAATSADLHQRVREGAFDEGLLAQLEACRLDLPPLRERVGDAVLLAEHFTPQLAPDRELALSTEVRWVLDDYAWPGNVAELEDCMDTACASAPGTEIQLSDLTPPLVEHFKRVSEHDAIPAQGPRAGAPKRNSTLREAYMSVPVSEEKPSLLGYEKQAILHALRNTKGDKLEAARLLDIGKSTFYRKLKAHGLS